MLIMSGHNNYPHTAVSELGIVIDEYVVLIKNENFPSSLDSIAERREFKPHHQVKTTSTLIEVSTPKRPWFDWISTCALEKVDMQNN